MTWLSNCRLLDVETGEIRPDVSIEIESGLIEDLEAGTPPANADVIDMRGRTILPGLISVHTHLTAVYPFADTDEGESPAVSVLRAVKRAKDALYAGVTTIRCLHEMNRADIYLRDAAAQGWIEAPRIISAGRAISTTGGHGKGFGCALADGFDAFLHAARAEFDAGADHIKVFITGGIADENEGFDVPQMTMLEMEAAVRAATEHHSYVVAHAGSAVAIQQAMDAGILAFEHGYWLDDETVGLMAERGAFLTPTLSVTSSPQWMRDHHFTQPQIDTAMAAGPDHLESIRRAVRAKVTLVNGTDYPPGEPCNGTSVAVHEMELMVKAGLSPLESIQAATVNAARLCRREAVIGKIQPGMAADLIAIDGNPVEDISAMRNLRFVVHDGAVVWQQL